MNIKVSPIIGLAVGLQYLKVTALGPGDELTGPYLGFLLELGLIRVTIVIPTLRRVK